MKTEGRGGRRIEVRWHETSNYHENRLRREGGREGEREEVREIYHQTEQ